MPAVTDPKQLNALIAGSVWRGFALIGQYLLPLLCLAGAGVSVFKRRQASQLHSDAVNRADGIAQMSWREFEVLVGEHFRQLGFSVTVTGGGGPDGGVDVLLRKGSDRYLVQCKHWRARRVGVEAVRELYGVMAAQRMAGGFVVTSGDFTEEARAFASGREVQLINGQALQQAVRAQSAATSPLNPQATLGGRRAAGAAGESDVGCGACDTHPAAFKLSGDLVPCVRLVLGAAASAQRLQSWAEFLGLQPVRQDPVSRQSPG
jgi:restriction system protein